MAIVTVEEFERTFLSEARLVSAYYGQSEEWRKGFDACAEELTAHIRKANEIQAGLNKIADSVDWRSIK
jgi:hypothetical protein